MTGFNDHNGHVYARKAKSGVSIIVYLEQLEIPEEYKALEVLYG